MFQTQMLVKMDNVFPPWKKIRGWELQTEVDNYDKV